MIGRASVGFGRVLSVGVRASSSSIAAKRFLTLHHRQVQLGAATRANNRDLIGKSFGFSLIRNMTYPTKTMEGTQVPEVVLKARENGNWKDINTKEFFKGKTVVVFSLPGAYTPTCSTTHLPRYEQLYAAFKENGVDAVACISVNDGFVMESWGKDQGVKNVVLLPDGNCDFTEAVGMKCDKSAIGFGPRSWRYSMLVKDGKIEKVFSEPEKEGDPFEVSDAETMLKHINPNAKIPPCTVLFTKVGCPHCARAKSMLAEHGLAYEEVIVGLGGTVSSSALIGVSGKGSVPQIFMDGKHIGGADDLEIFMKKRKA